MFRDMDYKSFKLVDVLKSYPQFTYAPTSPWDGFLIFFKNWETATTKDKEIYTIRPYKMFVCSKVSCATLINMIKVAKKKGWLIQNEDTGNK